MSRLCSCGLQVQPQVHLMDVLAAPAWRWPLVECNPFTFTHVGVVVSGESGSDPVPFCLCPLCAPGFLWGPCAVAVSSVKQRCASMSQPYIGTKTV
jgi:hypothetical protein